MFENQTPEQLVNITFNQRPKMANRYEPGAIGVASYLQKLQQDIANNRYASLPEKVRRRLLKMDCAKTAGYLCNTIQRYLHLALNGAVTIPFDQFYLNAIVNEAYRYQPGWRMYASIKNERAMLEPYLHYDSDRDKYPTHYVELKRGKYLLENGSKIKQKFTPEQMVTFFQHSCVKYCLLRNGKNTHTYGAMVKGADIICLDTYHNEWTGKSLFDRARKEGLRYLYYYIAVD